MQAAAIAQHRLVQHRLLPETGGSPGAVVAHLVAMQAQDYLQALWSVGMRSPGATEAGVEQAIAERKLVRSWPMRGTLHFVAPADLRWLLKLLAPRIIAASASRCRELELDTKIFLRAEKIFTRALEGGHVRTREHLMELLEAAGISSREQRGYHILWRLAQEGLLCFGTRAGKQHTFVLLEEWLPAAPGRETEAALAELAARYFGSHGPATLADFAWWSGLKMSEARRGLELAAPALASWRNGEAEYWFAPAASESPRRWSACLHLSPGFDEYLLGYTDRTAVLDPAHGQKVMPGANGMFAPTLLWNGRVIGTWKRLLKKKQVVVTPTWFRPPSPAEQSAFQRAADIYGNFLGLVRA